jgi:hypothetical protein
MKIILKTKIYGHLLILYNKSRKKYLKKEEIKYIKKKSQKNIYKKKK